MRLYAQTPARAGRQVLHDLGAVAWCAVFAWLSHRAYLAVLGLQAPGLRMIDAGRDLERTMGDAARTASRVPLVGDDLAGALDRGTAAGDMLTDAGRTQVDAVSSGALAAAGLVVLLALIPLVRWWLLPRIEYARAATAACELRTAAPDLLALRALSTVPYRKLRAVHEDPAAAWREGSGAVIDSLAALHLARLGLHRAETSEHRPGR
ncbi:hypothetical protein OOZ19_21050 [Saccharopolyspora sp. NFXS83]|uniref:hypothetical protein n=1 Tax=Saccharopolyspora sp. NFXS83 TaxID=2993560 RepID=UPI00224AF074|nr:hypothetical protein [Saccharopolyspora sp. NFXS83]MCX2732733.1 hypothetical protein [Saccharopolyspora sp. NFXS83]